jgi:iron complex outermembrane recepter protein
MNFLKTSLSKPFNWSYPGAQYLWFISSAIALIVTQTAWASETAIADIPVLSGRDRLSTSATELISQEENSNQSAVLIVGVKLNPTATGLEVLLETATKVILQPVTRAEGNTLVVELTNAVLDLPEGKPFQAENPVVGITAVTVTQVDANRIQVSITGEASAPIADVKPNPNGLRLGVMPAAADAEEELVVTGAQRSGYSVPNATAATKTDTPLRDIPQSIQIVPRQVIEDQGITQIIDAARNVSGVNNRAGFGGVADDYNIRGFDNFDKLRDGYFSSFSEVATNNIDQVEVLKGPASVLYGQFEPGGTINYITKKPLAEPFYSGEFKVGSYSFYQPSFDISGPLTTDKRLRYRLNASYENSGSFVDFVDREVVQVAPSLSCQIGENTTLAFSYEYVKSNGTFYDGLPVDPVLFDLPRSRFIGEPSNFLKQESNNINLTLEHSLNENWKVRSGLAIQIFGLENGAFRPESVDEDGQTLNRFYQADVEYSLDTYDVQVDLIGKFKTGPVQHQLLTGFNYQRYFFDDLAIYASAPPIDLFDPIYGTPVPTVFDPDQGSGRFTSRRNTVGFYLQDQVTLLSNLKLLIGGRYDLIDQQDIFQPVDQDGRTPFGEATEDTFDNEAFSPRIGIVYQPVEPLSLYASFSRSFVPNNTRDRNNDLLPPTRGTQYEVGVRAELLNKKLAANLAAYDITKTNVATTDPDDPQFSVSAGEVKSRGVEFDLVGEPLPGWNIIASLFVNDAFVSKDNDPALVDEKFINAPNQGATLWTTYEIQKGPVQGLGFGAGIFFVGDREVELPNTFVLPSYMRFDTSIFYKRTNWRVQVNFKNLFDKTYL